ILIAPPTFMMGMSFPFLHRAVQNNAAWVGRRVGWLQAANIFGATLGAISVGGFFLRMLGTTGVFRLLIALGATFLTLWAAVLFQPHPTLRRRAHLIAMGIIALVIWSVPSRSALWGS